ncbi:oxidoreductase [Prolixibacter bellariivorans]|uniref:Oxidoreductase n=2 Tax=Prolixibacter bellariivorans TaxID=314319 RepID=A0A5M4B463_9BACT|nr:FAD-binding and (Fe-S)-binding domain-containing protein [Prolixibacter bellariivorans]GET34945.1 oxidoreductase [Prolixibacter bellariivorans]
MSSTELFESLAKELEGELFTDQVHRIIYSTDASSYREKPMAVTIPKNKSDIIRILKHARENQLSVIPRAAGTSLAGQVVGSGIVMDISKHMDRILEFNQEEKWVRVEPGVNLAELNLYLKPYGLQFGPETSTANRCRIGGMLGNNSCGLHSLIYGSVRDHILEVEAFLADGSEVTFGPLSKKEFEAKCNADPEKLETKIYLQLKEMLENEDTRRKIEEVYPEKSVTRRNMGYAIDILMDTDPFVGNGVPFNIAKLLAGSEGTLAFSTSIKLNLIPLPPKVKGVIAAHFSSLEDAFRGNIVALQHKPGAIEMMDDIIIECTKENIEQRKNRFFLQGEPKAVLVIEFARETKEEIEAIHEALVKDMEEAGYGYHFPLIFGDEQIQRVWNLRTAGLGLLSNIPGDRKSTTVIEDTAVSPDKLPEYMAEFQQVLDGHGLQCVFYAHIATGEIHLRPLLNLKDKKDQELYSTLAQDVAGLVKKYRGSLSGEHGDGRLRGSFIPFMFGDEIYGLFKELKKTWDPWNILNPGKITDVPPITQNLRYNLNNHYPEIETVSDFSSTKGFLRAVEKCNGSGDCRKSEVVGGTMCPTFMATRDEDKSTRGRANILREFLHHSENDKPLDHPEIYQVLDLCISCKACKAECPSNIDMAKFKAEFLQYYYDEHGAPLRSKLIAWLPRMSGLASAVSPLANWNMNMGLTKRLIGFHPKRSMPAFTSKTLKGWANKNRQPEGLKGKVYLFADEFTNYQESDIGIKAILLLTKLGYSVEIPKHRESGRTFLSKGFMRESKKIANDNVRMLKDKISVETPMIGIEPSTILTFRDEYPELVDEPLREAAVSLGENALLFEEFFVREMEKGNISAEQFTTAQREIKLHGHCQQKAVASTTPTKQMLSLPPNYQVSEIKSGCCGMAGSFGYEKEHYELSMQIGEMVLFPEVRKSAGETTIAAPGTSCRHHIKDGTGRKAIHPIEVMYDALA